MKITEADVGYVAQLASLEVAAGEKKELAEDLNRILDYVQQLNALDVSEVDATAHIVTGDRPAMREDRVAPRTGSADTAKGARLFKVPKVITER